MIDIHAVLGSYVTDALGSAEESAFESHLASCPSCRIEVLQLRQTLAELTALASAPAPPAVRAHVVAAISRVRPPPPPDAPPRGLVVTRHRLSDIPRQRHLQQLVTPLLIGVTAAAVVAAVVLGGAIGALNHQREALTATRSAQSTADQQEAELLTASDLQILPTRVHGVAVSYLVSRKHDAAMLVGDRLPEPGSGRTYRVWILHGKMAVPAADVSGGNPHQLLSGPLARSTALVVTAEATNSGASQPTLPALSVVHL